MITWAWHVHHETLVEPLTEPIENRIAYIKAIKPEKERALRLRLLRVVKGELPEILNKSWAASDKVWAASDNPLPAAILALHAVECEPDCPWNGRTIFP